MKIVAATNTYGQTIVMEDEPNDLKSRFAVSPIFDAEIDVAGFGLVALHPDADHELRIKVTAAVIAHFQSYSSIDYVRKRYLEDTAEHIARDADIRRAVVDNLRAYDNFYHSIPPRTDERIGVFAFDLAFVRSCETVKLLLRVARQGFLLEPALIARSLVEQFAYAVSVWDTDDDSVIFGTKPQSVVASLKPLQPKIGNAYGLLSKASHYHPQTHRDFIGEDDGSQALTRSWTFKIRSLGWVFYILDLQYRVFEHCYGDHPSFEIVSRLKGNFLEDFDSFFAGVPTEENAFIRELLAAD